MLSFKQSDTTKELILTLTENVSLPVPYYLFVFVQVTTKEVVTFIKSVADDASAYPSRYNSFSINPSALFSTSAVGQWNYTVYEQASAVNTNPSAAGAVLERGKMILDRATAFTFPQYNSPTSFKGYNG